MRELITTIPDVDVLLALEPEELGAKMLFLMRQRREERYILNNIQLETTSNSREPHRYPDQRHKEITLAISEAWAWLESQGLIVPDEGTNGSNGWRLLSRRARRMESEAEFVGFRHSRLLHKEVLNPRIREEVWIAFVRGNYDGAVFQAMKTVEVAVREAGGFGLGLVGVKLMRDAFAPGRGPLADRDAELGEQEGRMNLFVAAMGCFKNPQSHRDVNLADPLPALEIIYLANHLLRIVDALRPPEVSAPS